MMTTKLDVAIIGAGTAGLSARSVVEKYTQNYMVFDAGTLGTTCARVGCMPSKVLIQSSNDYHRRFSLGQEGMVGGENIDIDVNKTFTHIRNLRDRFVRGVTSSIESWQDRYLTKEYVRFTSPYRLETSSGQFYEASKIIIGSGSTPTSPAVFDGFEDFCVNTDAFFELADIPKRWVVIGTGVIGMELGQGLHRAGCETTIIGRSQSLAGITDPKILSYTIEKMADEIPMLYGGVQKVEKEGDHLVITAGGKKVLADKILLAAGRTPNVKNLHLDNIGIEMGSHGVPTYNSSTMLVDGTEHIFIAGDTNGDKAILHEAADEGRIAGFNACAKEITAFERRTPLGITFTDPNIAFAGKTYQELTQENIAFDTGTVTFEGQGRSIVKLKEKGLLHVYADKNNGTLLGSELYAPDGEHLAHMLSWAISEKWTVDQTLSKPFYHPVIQEGLRTALRSIKKGTNAIEINPLSLG